MLQPVTFSLNLLMEVNESICLYTSPLFWQHNKRNCMLIFGSCYFSITIRTTAADYIAYPVITLGQCFPNCGAQPSSGSQWHYRWVAWGNSDFVYFNIYLKNLPYYVNVKYTRTAVVSHKTKYRARLNIGS